MSEETRTKKITVPKLANRQTLYNYFKNGQRPMANHFHDLINSTINKLEDGISKDFENGLQLAPKGEDGEKTISFYEVLDGSDPTWTISLEGPKSNKNLCIRSGKNENMLLTFTHDGKIGVNNAKPVHALDVNGNIGMSGRIGTYLQGTIMANGEWQTIINGLEGCQMFEVVAMAYGKKGKGTYASLHAIASNAYSGKRGRIHCSRDYYGWKWWRRLGLRWVGSPFNYKLQMKTFSNYGIKGKIEYSIMQLGKEIVHKN